MIHQMTVSPQVANHIDETVSPRLAIVIVLGEWLAAGRSSFWLQDLLSVGERLRIHPRSARTVVQRFALDGWFDITRHGRRSHYRLTPLARRDLRRGDERILATEPPAWNGHWQLLHVTTDNPAARVTIGRHLTWLGFGSLAASIWVSPWDHLATARTLILDLDPSAQVTAFAHAQADEAEAARFVGSCWDLDAIRQADQQFMRATERRLVRWTKRGPLETSRAQELLRLDAAFIRLLRRDPDLPHSLLPDDWPGHIARQRFSEARELLLAGRANIGEAPRHPFEPAYP
jgi:phenylacetic acid degradation operon negative regulatory protein